MLLFYFVSALYYSFYSLFLSLASVHSLTVFNVIVYEFVVNEHDLQNSLMFIFLVILFGCVRACVRWCWCGNNANYDEIKRFCRRRQMVNVGLSWMKYLTINQNCMCCCNKKTDYCRRQKVTLYCKISQNKFRKQIARKVGSNDN